MNEQLHTSNERVRWTNNYIRQTNESDEQTITYVKQTCTRWLLLPACTWSFVALVSLTYTIVRLSSVFVRRTRVCIIIKNNQTRAKAALSLFGFQCSLLMPCLSVRLSVFLGLNAPSGTLFTPTWRYLWHLRRRCFSSASQELNTRRVKLQLHSVELLFNINPT